MSMRVLAAALLLCVSANAVFAQKFEALAQTPQMGRNSWNKLGCNVDEKTICGMADARGLKDAGYEYIVIDDSPLAACVPAHDVLVLRLTPLEASR